MLSNQVKKTLSSIRVAMANIESIMQLAENCPELLQPNHPQYIADQFEIIAAEAAAASKQKSSDPKAGA